MLHADRESENCNNLTEICFAFRRAIRNILSVFEDSTKKKASLRAKYGPDTEIGRKGDVLQGSHLSPD